MVGLVGGTVEWIFAFPDRISVTVSGAEPCSGAAVTPQAARAAGASNEPVAAATRAKATRSERRTRGTVLIVPASTAAELAKNLAQLSVDNRDRQDQGDQVEAAMDDHAREDASSLRPDPGQDAAEAGQYRQ